MKEKSKETIKKQLIFEIASLSADADMSFKITGKDSATNENSSISWILV